VAEAAKRLNAVLVLGGTQTPARASSFYLPAVLPDRMAADIGMTNGWFFAVFSAALVIAALVGRRVGRTVDAIGGWEVLAASNVGAPSRVAMAAAPLLFGLLIDRYGVGVLVVSSALSIVALAGLFLVPIPSRSSQRPSGNPCPCRRNHVGA
jgi:hypothetical protein